MKIAVAAVGTDVAAALAHCENFIFFDVENGKIIAREDVPYPHHRSGFLPQFLAENGASVIIVGYPGQAIVDVFQKQNIKIVDGVEGDATDAVNAYLRGQ